MTTTLSSPTDANPNPVAKFRIGEREPLVWLVSLLFTNEFCQRENLVAGMFGLEEPGAGDDRKYESWPSFYQAVEDWVRNDKSAEACLIRAKEAVERRELVYYSPEADEWGDKPFHVPERDVYTFPFLLWAEKNGYPIPSDVFDASHALVHMEISRKDSEERQAAAYPVITPEDFMRLRKKPLWPVGAAILYVLGRRSRIEGKEADYLGDKGGFLRMLQYVLDAYKAEQLSVIGYSKVIVLKERKSKERIMLEAKVKPEDFIKWALTLPIKLPMLSNKPTEVARPDYCTPDMQLMYDAVEKFWSDYDLNNPNPNVAPMKQDVVAWLMEEAGRRKITFSKTRAEHIDTIIRCPVARKGGNSL